MKNYYKFQGRSKFYSHSGSLNACDIECHLLYFTTMYPLVLNI